MPQGSQQQSVDNDEYLSKFLDNSQYEERADYLSEEQLNEWTAKNSENFEHIQHKLIQVGAKLISGPRGTGKTHQMKCAFNRCSRDQNLPLPIYVTFNHYLRLETYLHEKSNALNIFHAWVLCKILKSAIDTYDSNISDTDLSRENINSFILDIERNQYNEKYNKLISKVSITLVQSLIYRILGETHRKRAILLLDDAALTLTHDYMVEFFDIFRSIKSMRISPKASVYPGTTQYGPRFHVGQDAERVSIWMDVQEKDFIPFMKKVTEKRFDKDLTLSEDELILFMYASFGNPRAYINLIRSYLDSNKSSTQQKINTIIQDHTSNIISEYKSIADKITQYKSFIDIGHDFLLKIINLLKDLNYKNQTEKGESFRKNITLGIEDIDEKAERMIKFLIEAGLLFELPSVSHGSERKLRRFVPHIALLIEQKALFKSRGFSVKKLISILSSTSEKHPLRRKFNSVLSKEAISNIKLDLPACNHCGTSRIADGQKFCHICGKELVEPSIFKECMSKKLVELPFTKFQHKVIALSKFLTIEDVLVADDAIERLKKVRRVGPKYAEKIVNKINSWTNEFLY
ncbi:zinc ribbon domain-containing protein [Shewanella algae]|uniref:zinc ribbon domain-containing protein n=1 Tax=Shewanella algae TaxID=38313 RepID=UPI0031F494FF